MKKQLNKIVSSLIIVAGIAAGIGIVSFADSNIKPMLFPTPKIDNPIEFEIPKFETNENGETYGSAMDVSPEHSPNLTLVLGDNGKEGYCRTIDLMGETPKSPEEAIRIQEERIKNGDTKRIINVYEKDGITVIDTFTIELNLDSVEVYYEKD